MLQLKNSTPFAANIAVFPNERGVDTIFTIVKATFCFSNGWTLADEQIPPQAEDEYWGEPGKSSLKLASDFHTGKAVSDIVVLGSACAPNQQTVAQLDVSVNVGSVNKSLRVTGNRTWQNGSISDVEPFKTMPLVYEKAFGGQHWLDDQNYLAVEQNPVGCGFAGNRSEQDMQGEALPNIENNEQLIQSFQDTPLPAGFGFNSPDWLPRRQYAGTYDEKWQQTRAPYLPEDFDKRFLNAAHPDLVYPGFLQGGERFSVSNMHPDGVFFGELPQIILLCDVKLGHQIHKPSSNLETVIIEPNKKQVSMVWKAAFECDKNVLKVEEIGLKLAR